MAEKDETHDEKDRQRFADRVLSIVEDAVYWAIAVILAGVQTVQCRLYNPDALICINTSRKVRAVLLNGTGHNDHTGFPAVDRFFDFHPSHFFHQNRIFITVFKIYILSLTFSLFYSSPCDAPS